MSCNLKNEMESEYVISKVVKAKKIFFFLNLSNNGLLSAGQAVKLDGGAGGKLFL